MPVKFEATISQSGENAHSTLHKEVEAEFGCLVRENFLEAFDLSGCWLRSVH
jgi:hypothetical protein